MSFTGFPYEGLRMLTGLPELDPERYATLEPARTRLVLQPARDFVADLGARLAGRVSAGLVAVPKVNGSISPLSNDRRFNPAQPPYKDHLLFRWWEGEPKKHAPTLYVRLDADRVGYASGLTFLSSAGWREALDNASAATALRRAIDDLTAQLPGIEVAGRDLRRPPRGYPPDHPGGDLLRHRAMLQLRWTEPTPAEVATESFLDHTLERLVHFTGMHRLLIAHFTAAPLRDLGR